MKPTRPFALGLTSVLSLAALAACSSSGDRAEQTFPESRTGAGAGGEGASIQSVRAELALAIVSGARPIPEAAPAFRRDVDSWVARLSPSVLCSAADAAKTTPYFSVGVALGSARREIVFDLRERQAAVFTKKGAAALGDRAHLFMADAFAPSDEDGGIFARLDAESARRIRGFVGVDGATYGDAYVVSAVATRALGDASPAANIVTYAGPSNALALRAAVMTVAAHAASLCTSSSSSAVTTRALKPLEDGIGTNELDAWLAEAPTATQTEAATFETAASCATSPELACTGGAVCNPVGESYCCTAERPVTQACGAAMPCDDGMSCIRASEKADGDGNIFTCASSSADSCSAVAADQSTACWGSKAFTTTYETYLYQGHPREAVEAACTDVAKANAKDECLASVSLCTATPGEAVAEVTSCDVRDGGFIKCKCKAMLDCKYSFTK